MVLRQLHSIKGAILVLACQCLKYKFRNWPSWIFSYLMIHEMRNLSAILIAITVVVVVWSSVPAEEISTVEIVNDRLVILFKKECEYSAISLDDKNGDSLSEVIFSIYPGGGPIFKENTYIDISSAFKYKLQNNHEYRLRLSTDCLGNNQIPVYRLNFNTNGLKW